MKPNNQELEIIKYARSAYGFLTDQDYTKTNGELAAAIKEYYDIEDSQSKAVYDALMKYSELKGDKL